MPLMLKRTAIVSAAKRPLRPAACRPAWYGGIELDAKGHWVFGTDHPTYDDLISGQVLSPKSGGHLPTLGSNYLATAGGGDYGMNTPYADGADMTICAVVNNANGGQSLFDTYTSSGGAKGIVLFENSSYGPQWGMVDIGALAAEAIVVPAPVTPSGTPSTTWLFVGASRTQTRLGNVGSRIVYWGDGTNDAANFTKLSGVVTPNPSGFFSIGSGAFGTNPSLRIAELIIYDRGLTLWEMRSLYVRAKARMSDRGITVH